MEARRLDQCEARDLPALAEGRFGSNRAAPGMTDDMRLARRLVDQALHKGDIVAERVVARYATIRCSCVEIERQHAEPPAQPLDQLAPLAAVAEAAVDQNDSRARTIFVEEARGSVDGDVFHWDADSRGI